MKALKKNKKYIKDVIEHGTIGGSYYYGPKKKRTFTIEDLKEFGPKNRLKFLQSYYWIKNHPYYKGGGTDIQYWIDNLTKHNIDMVLLTKSEIRTLLFPMIVDEEYGEDAANTIKSHSKIIKSLSGMAVMYKKEAQKYLKKSQDLKNKLVASGNWSWSKKKEDL